MFLSRFFTKDYHSCMEKGDRHFAEERYAEARHAFIEALERLNATEGSTEARESIDRKLAETGNRLGLLNLKEAEHAISRGEVAKAEEHLGLVLEFTDDNDIRGKVEKLMNFITSSDSSAHSSIDAPQVQDNCSGCSSKDGAVSEEGLYSADHLSDEERFELLVQTLPADLTERYIALGDDFAHAYLLIHDGEDHAGAAILRELLRVEENDILLYELALVEYRTGNPSECETLLRRAMILNDLNALCCLGLVQLLADTGRLTDCIPVLNYMVERNLLTEQALIILPDIHYKLGNEEEAMAGYTKAITHPGAAKAAAERLIPLLQKQGRAEEASYIAKKYLKGCC